MGILHGENLNPSQPCEGARGGPKTCHKFTMSLILRSVNDFNVSEINHRSSRLGVVISQCIEYKLGSKEINDHTCLLHFLAE